MAGAPAKAFSVSEFEDLMITNELPALTLACLKLHLTPAQVWSLVERGVLTITETRYDDLPGPDSQQPPES